MQVAGKSLYVALAGEPIESAPFVVMAASEVDREGSLTLVFYGNRTPVFIDEDVVQVELRENEGKGFGDSCLRAVDRLAHLRLLHRLGKLTEPGYAQAPAAPDSRRQLGSARLDGAWQPPPVWRTTRGSIAIGGRREGQPTLELSQEQARLLAEKLLAVAGSRPVPADR